MMTVASEKRLSVFVHRASECLTDHEPHGDGLICFSLLNGLAERGHKIFAYANSAPILRTHPNLQVKTARHRVPANSLASWEHSWRADRWLKELSRTTPIDLVWRMHPYGAACPYPPQTLGRPLVVGPLFYGWPRQPGMRVTTGLPRLGVGIAGLVEPFGLRGWHKTLGSASLILCATENHSAATKADYAQARVQTLPVIVDTPPAGLDGRPSLDGLKPSVRLLFVANLVPNKRPRIFCETIQRLRARGIEAQGVLLGDGPERGALEAYCVEQGLKSAVCFRGKVANSEVFQHMREAHFLMSTSLGEPYGRGIAEAMAVGTPAICHRSGGPADFIADGQDGLLVEELTAAAYADRIARVLADSAAWGALSDNARRKAENWRSEVVLDQLEHSLYEATRPALGRRQRGSE